MDFPLFHLDFFGNRLLVAAIAVFHVFINHPLAVGAIPLIALLEWWGRRTGEQRWDQLAYKILFVCFIITTSAGALSGVGIWLSTSLVNPAAIGSLIRVFFWAWFTEWVVFCLEVIFILIYFKTWKGMQGPRKGSHVAMGFALAAFSWGTMAIIVAILAFMMTPGSWMSERTFFSGVLNPIYLPQLAFRTPLAMSTAGTFALLLTGFFTRRDPGFRGKAVRFVAIWILAWLPLTVAGALWYYDAVPAWMIEHVPVALTTQKFTQWHQSMVTALVAMAVGVGIVGLWGVSIPRTLPRVVMVVPFVLSLLTIASFERVREFIRKPYIISEYMYASGIREEDYPLLAEEGVLAHSTYVSTRVVTDDNRVEAGREVFRVACSRCHTTTGVNGVAGKLTDMYGPDPWDRDTVKAYVGAMHVSRPFMPPFPGTDAEAGALADYLLSLQTYPQRIHGVQGAGIALAGEEDGR